MDQNKETRIEENNTFSTPFQENSNSILKPRLKPILQPKVGPHTRVWGNTQKEETTKTSVTTQLPEEVQAKMESSFSQDFSNVNIHKDSSSAKDINAKAYAQGTDIHFAPGEYNPTSKEGQELIGHELTHVVQQGQGKVGSGEIHGKGLEINQDASLEKEADDAGKLASEGKSVQVNNSGKGLQMSPTDERAAYLAKYQSDYNIADQIAQRYLSISSATLIRMLNDYNAAQEEVKRIMELKDDTTWRDISVAILSIAIAAVPGAGPVANRLMALSNSKGGFFAAGLAEGLKTVSTSLVQYGLALNYQVPKISAESPTAFINESINIFAKETFIKEDLFIKWQKAWDIHMKTKPLHTWKYNLQNVVAGMFNPAVAIPSFQTQFEIMLIEKALAPVEALTANLLFGGETVYSFSSAQLSRTSLQELTKKYGWTVRQVNDMCKAHWNPPYAPWNAYTIKEGEQP